MAGGGRDHRQSAVFGRRELRAELGDEYVDALRKLYEGLRARWGESGVLLVRTGAGANRCGEGKTSGAVGDTRHPWWCESQGAGSNKANR